jgi:homeobox protein cut-like
LNPIYLQELRKQFETISELRTDIKTLQADNLKLYEKIRYMQSYQDEGPIGSSAAGPSNVAGTSYTRAAASTSVRRDDLGKYRNLYEQNMNPFEAFRGREAVRAVQALNPLERGVLTLTQAILGNRRTRLYVLSIFFHMIYLIHLLTSFPRFFIVYAMALHFLVIFTSYECTSVGGSNSVIKVPH